jgi:hypothetical protein
MVADDPKFGPLVLQIYRSPVDLESLVLRKIPPDLDLRLVAIEGNDVGAPCRGGHAVPALAAGQVEYPRTLADEEVMPGEPGAGIWQAGNR